MIHRMILGDNTAGFRTPPMATLGAVLLVLAGWTLTANGQDVTLLQLDTLGAVENRPTQPTTFTMDAPSCITKIRTYHWNRGRGSAPGTISLQDQTGEVLGTWDASGEPGSGGVPNAYWEVEPRIELPAGTYTVLDSDPATWSHNRDTGGRGITWVYGRKPAAPHVEPPAPKMPPTNAAGTETRTIGPEGGVVALADGTLVELPAGAVEKDVSVAVRAVDPGEHFQQRDDRVRYVIECTAPVRRFSAPVKIHFPLPEEATLEAAEGMEAGYIDAERGMKVDLPCTFAETDGRKELVLETTHFTSFYLDRLKNLFSSPPASRTVENVPYYSQDSSTYCWAACTQMICEAVTEEDTPGEIWDVIGRMKVPPTGLTSFTAAFSGTWSSVMRERTRVSPDLCYWQASMVRLRSYIYEQIGLYGHPVLYSSSSFEHSVVIVGYDTTPAEPVFIVNDPGAVGRDNVAYRRVTASRLRLGDGESLTNPVVTAVLDKDVSARPAVRVSLATQCFGVKTVAGGASHLWTWDHTRARGYSFKTDPLSEQGIDVIPGTIAKAEGKTFIEVSNATSTEQALSCDYSIRWQGNAVVQKHNYVVVPAYGLAVVPVDSADFEALRAKGPLGPEYTFHVQLLKGGDFIDTARMDFSECQRPPLAGLVIWACGKADVAWGDGREEQGDWNIQVRAANVPVQWNGDRFTINGTAKTEGSDFSFTITGTLSQDGGTITGGSASTAGTFFGEETQGSGEVLHGAGKQTCSLRNVKMTLDSNASRDGRYVFGGDVPPGDIEATHESNREATDHKGERDTPFCFTKTLSTIENGKLLITFKERR